MALQRRTTHSPKIPNPYDHPRFLRAIRRFEAAERQKLLLEKKETGDDFWAEYERDLARLDEARKKLEELEAENANLRANQQVFFAAEAGGSDELTQQQETEDLSFSSVAEAVQAAAKRCNNVEILDTATSAAEASPFQRPYDIFKALTDLDEIVDAWSKNRDEKGSGGEPPCIGPSRDVCNIAAPTGSNFVNGEIDTWRQAHAVKPS